MYYQLINTASMDTKTKNKPRKRLFYNPFFAARPQYNIICPRCGMAQSREEDACRACGIAFYFLDESNQYARF